MKLKYFVSLLLLLVFINIGLSGQNTPFCKIENDSFDLDIKSRLRANQFLAERQDLSSDSLIKLIVENLNLTCALHDTLKARVFHNIGVIYYILRKYNKAKLNYIQALKIREKHLPKNHPDIIRSFNNIGSCYLTLSQNGYGYFLDSAAYYLDKSIRLNLARKPSTSDLGNSYIHFSRVARRQGDLDNVTLFLSSAINQFSNDPNRGLNRAIAANDLSALFSISFKEIDSALKYVDMAIQFYANKGPLSRRDKIRLSDCLMTKGTAFMQSGNHAEALPFYIDALNTILPYSNEVPSKLADIHNNIAILKIHTSDYSEGIDSLRSAVRINRSIENFSGLAGNYDNLGDAWMGLGEYDSALSAYQLAILYNIPGYDSRDKFSNPPIKNSLFFDHKGVIVSLSSKAKALMKMYENKGKDRKYLEAAYDTYFALDSLILFLRQSYHNEGSKASHATLVKPIYEQAIGTCWALYQLNGDAIYKTQAFAYSEKSKSVILLDALRNSQAIKKSLALDAQMQLKSISQRKDYYERLKAELSWGENAFALKEKAINDSLIKYRQLESDYLATLKKKNPEYFELTQNISTLSPFDIQQKGFLELDQGLIEYFVGDSSIFTFLITSDQFEFNKIPRDRNLGQIVSEFRYALNSQNALDSLDHYLPILYQRSYTLYTQLFDWLENLDKLPQRLIIVRDEMLSYVPFEVLLTQEVLGDIELGKESYLIKKKTISYTFSANLLDSFRENEISPQSEFIAFAPITFKEVRQNNPGLFTSGLADLINTEGELNEVNKIKAGQIFFRGNSLLARFLREAKKYNIVYLASHGIINEEEPRLNGILFHDSVLFTADLYKLSLNAEMVVLRACESGFGKLTQGEGIASLDKGFAQAGAKSVFATQWLVPDATRLMANFIGKIYQDMPKDIALQEAKMGLVRDEHPFYWAGYEIRGDVSSISSIANFWGIILKILLFVFLVIGGFAVISRIRS